MNERGQGATEYALSLLLVVVVAMFILAMVGVGAGLTQAKVPPPPAPIGKWGEYPDLVNLTLTSEAVAQDTIYNRWLDVTAKALAAGNGLTVEALDLAHQRLYHQLYQAAVELEAQSSTRLTHLLKDRAHVTAWLAVKLAVKLGVQLETYWCPANPSLGHCNCYVFVVCDEEGQLCAAAFVKEPTLDEPPILLTAYYDVCKSLRRRLAERGCIRVFNVVLRIP